MNGLMEYSVLYEFSVFNFLPRNLIFLLIIIVGILAYKFSNPSDEDSDIEVNKKFVSKYIISILFIVVGTFCFFFDKYKLVETAINYKNKKYETIEGYVSDFKQDTLYNKFADEFKIDTIQFKIGNGTLTSPGYDTKLKDGGVIKDSLFLKISYFSEQGENSILKIEQRIDKR